MTEIKKNIEQGFASGGLYDILTALENANLPISGRTYFVSGYGNNTTGLSWENAYTTIAAAIAASNTYIALGTVAGGRNRIYVDSNKAANWDETLTVFPNQCDLIGVGSKGGWMTTINGRTNITTACLGTHVYNIRFINPTSGVPVITILDGSHGFEIHNCRIRNNSGNDSSVGLKIGSLWDFTVSNNLIYGNPPSVIGILLDGTACGNSKIVDNYIYATTTGLQIADGTTSDYGLVIKGNVIVRLDPNSVAQMTTGILISDTASRCHTAIVDNFISAADAINFVGSSYQNMDKWLAMGNTIVEAATSTMETVIVDG